MTSEPICIPSRRVGNLAMFDESMHNLTQIINHTSMIIIIRYDMGE